MTEQFDPADDRFASDEANDPASKAAADWDESLYDRLNDIVDDAETALSSWQPGTLFKRQRLIMIAGVLIIVLFVWLTISAVGKNRGANQAPETGAIPTATFTPTPPAQPAQPTATPTPSPTPTSTPAPSIQVGSRVRVTITDGSGMRFRSGPGTDYITLSIMPDGAEFVVVEGPRENEEGVWWRLKAEDGTIGWGAAELLELVGE